MKQENAACYDAEYREKICRTYIKDGFLLLLPDERKARRVILDYLASDFALGKGYAELEVNFKILDHYDEYQTVLHALLSEGIMRKEKGLYYRVKGE